MGVFKKLIRGLSPKGELEKVKTPAEIATDDEKFAAKIYVDFDTCVDAYQGFRQRCKINEKLYQGNTWDALLELGVKVDDGEPQPSTPVIFSTIDNFEADMLDSMPESVYLPQKTTHKEIADTVTKVIEQICEDGGFGDEYYKFLHDVAITGNGVLHTIWDDSLEQGVGNGVHRHWDIRNFYADPLCENIQEGRFCIKFSPVSREWIKEHYPTKYAEIKGDKYRSERTTYNNSAVEQTKDDDLILLEYWYKEYNAETKKTSVHMAVLCGGTILDKQENVYEHGQYPFTLFALYPLKGSPIGFGIIDVFMWMQIYADKLDQVMFKNAAMSGKTKVLVNRNAGLDEEAINDWSSEVIHGDRVDEGAVRFMNHPPLPSYMASIAPAIREFIKEESGQNQFGRGEGGKGITAASAIQALQNAAGKRSRKNEKRLHNTLSNNAFSQMLEIVRENMTESRLFMLIDRDPQTGANIERDQEFSAEMLFNGDEPIRFKTKARVQRKKDYDTMVQNNFAIQIATQNAPLDLLLAVMPMMTFDGKDEMMKSLAGLNQTQKQLQEATAALEQMAQERETMAQEIQRQKMVIDKSLAYVKQKEVRETA